MPTNLGAGEILSIITGTLPITLVIVGGIVFGIMRLFKGFTPADYSELTMVVVIIVLLFLFVWMVIANVHFTIHPREAFEDVGAVAADPATSLLAAIAAAEKDACDLVTRTDQFIQNDVGKPGQDNPALVTAAQQKSRDGAGGPLTVCGSGSNGSADISGDELNEAANRIARLETTVLKFTAPEVKRTYDASNTCEGFTDQAAAQAADQIADLTARLKTVTDAIALQKNKYIAAIDAKTASLQRGELSDCDRKKGASSGATAAGAPKGSVPSVHTK